MPVKIAIFGAGSIGCYIGGRLAAAGADVVLIGRERIAREVAQHGLTLSDINGQTLHHSDAMVTSDMTQLEERDLVLVCVKSGNSIAAATNLRPHLGEDTSVVSLQNGIHNAASLASVLGRPVVPGMVGFNVASLGQGQFHQGTEGDIYCAHDPVMRRAAARFASAGLSLKFVDDMQPVLWAKLMLNLNNAVNALANIPLKEQLSQRKFRECLARAQEELLLIAEAAGLPPFAKLSPLPARHLPRVLRLPDPLFRLVAGRMLAIDPLARSSMSDDLALGREPEVEWINGEVVRLAESVGLEAPVNARLTQLVTRAAQARERPSWNADALLMALHQGFDGETR